jgi:hypothetical protein
MNMSCKQQAWNTNWNNIGSTDMATVRDKQDFGMFAYTQLPVKFENPHKCRNALGLVGGSEVSNIAGNLVDLESDLFGFTRVASKCIARQYVPACPLGGKGCPDYPPSFEFRSKSTGKVSQVDTHPLNLPTCQNVTYPGVGSPQSLHTDTCYPMRF